MEQNFIRHGDDFVVITGNTRCTNGDCPYIKYVGECLGNIVWQSLRCSSCHCSYATHIRKCRFLDEEGELNIWIEKQ